MSGGFGSLASRCLAVIWSATTIVYRTRFTVADSGTSRDWAFWTRVGSIPWEMGRVAARRLLVVLGRRTGCRIASNLLIHNV